MGILSELEPKKVFQFFEEICSIPHGSHNTDQISRYLVDFAKKRELKYRQDAMGNVVIWKNGSAGYENCAPVILQGHIDMVAVKDADCEKNMEKEGLDLMIEDDLILAKGTSLGGDNGIAVAYSLAILDDSSLIHPPVEAVFTVDEEIGMLGADYLDMSDLKGRLFLNMDSEDEGVFTVSCAGGAKVTCHFPYQTEKKDVARLVIKADQFTGGHSGVEIDKGRANANVVMGRILLAVNQRQEMRLVKMNGGEKDNAIADCCEAVIAVKPEEVEQAEKTICDIFVNIREEYKTTDPAARLRICKEPSEETEIFTKEATSVIINAIINLPNGIQRMNPEMEGMVQTSLNLGAAETKQGQVELSYAVRSSSENEKQYLIDRITCFTELSGGRTEVTGVYPGWEYKAESRLRDVMISAYKELYKEEPKVEGIHAGLECGLFASRLEGLDAVSIGPQMKNVHTTKEVLSISSAKRTWELILKALEMLK